MPETLPKPSSGIPPDLTPQEFAQEMTDRVAEFLQELFKIRHKPKPPRCFRVHFFNFRRASKMSTCVLTWVDSVTPDVTSQRLSISVNGTAQPDVVLGPSVFTYNFPCNPGDQIAASLVATNAVGDSTPATVSGTAPPPPPPPPPPPTVPAAPTGLTIAFQ